MLKYSTPLALQFFSQEERFALTSLPEILTVRPLPSEGRPADFNGAVGSGLRVERRITPPTAHPGEGVAVELVLSGVGNSALWPPPAIRWPRTARAYADRVDEQVTTVDGQVGGVKSFRYLVVPDSIGPLTLPPVELFVFRFGCGIVSLSRCRGRHTAGGEGWGVRQFDGTAAGAHAQRVSCTHATRGPGDSGLGLGSIAVAAPTPCVWPRLAAPPSSAPGAAPGRTARG